MGRLAGVLVVAVLGLGSGCSGGGEPEASPATSASSSPTSGASASASASASVSAEPEPEPAPVDPCALLTADDLEGAGVRAETDGAVRGFGADTRSTVCQVADPKQGWAIFYGFSTKPGVKVADAIAEVGTEKPVRLSVGDDSRMVLYAAYGDRIWHAWASQGRATVMLQLWEKPRPAAVEGLLSTMLEQATPDMFRFPVDLPAGCPKPATRAITALLGPVATATGSEREDDLRCDYANARGLSLNLAASPYGNAQKVRQTVGQVAEYYEEREQPARGVTLFISPGDGYAFTGTYLERPPGQLATGLQSRTPIGDYYRPLDYDAEKYRALARWWSQQRPDVLG